MILGILSDIHSNSFALQHTLQHNTQVDQWLCLGDFTGLLPNVNETIELLRKHNVICIRGDHEQSLVQNTSLPQSISASEVLTLQRQVVPDESKKWIQKLESNKKIQLGGIRIQLIHTITGDDDKKKYSFDLEYLEKEYADTDLVLFGHTHLPFYWEGKTCLFINPGSLGFPISKLKQGSYALFNTTSLENKFFKADIHTQDCIDVLKKYSYPKRIIDLVKENSL